jgi:hypothetical protein
MHQFRWLVLRPYICAATISYMRWRSLIVEAWRAKCMTRQLLGTGKKGLDLLLYLHTNFRTAQSRILGEPVSGTLHRHSTPIASVTTYYTCSIVDVTSFFFYFTQYNADVHNTHAHSPSEGHHWRLVVDGNVAYHLSVTPENPRINPGKGASTRIWTLVGSVSLQAHSRGCH